MIKQIRTFISAFAILAMATPALSQQVLETYRAEIDAVDRVNSRGQPIDGLAGFLTQDRANVHRFGKSQPGDTLDSVFDQREARAIIWRFLQSGSVTPEAEAALRGGGNPVLEVTIWGQGRSVSYLTVDVARGGAQSTALASPPADAPITSGELAQNASQIQAALNERGFDAGPVDGQPGQRTRDAIAAFQSSLGASATGALTQSQLGLLTGVGSQQMAGAPSSMSNAGSTMPGTEAEIAGRDGLIYMQGKYLWSALTSYSLRLPQDAAAQDAHEMLLTDRLIYTSWDVASNDLFAGLDGVDGHEYISHMADVLPEAAIEELTQFALDLSNAGDARRSVCASMQLGRRLTCASSDFETEFDRRRFQQAMAETITRVVAEEKLDLPVPVHALCPIERIDRAYDFDTSRVNWAELIGSAPCRLTNKPINFKHRADFENDLNLAAAVPESTEMAPDVVEALAKSVEQPDERGSMRSFPLLLSFDGEIHIERTEGDRDIRGLAPVKFTLKRTGPVSLRSAAAPTEAVLQFGAPGDSNKPIDALDIFNSSVAYRLFEAAPPLDRAQLAADAATLTDGQSGTLVRIPVFMVYEDGGGVRISPRNYFRDGEPAKRVATQLELPAGQVGWAQPRLRERGVPDTELVLTFPVSIEALVSELIDEKTAEAAQRGDTAFLLARMSEPMATQGVGGPAIVAAVQPFGFEVQDRGIGDDITVVARPALMPVTVAPVDTVFLASPWWFAAKGADLQGRELASHLDTLFESSRIFRGDTFAKLDAIEATKQTILDRDLANKSAPWIAGRISLDAYDLERKGWPVRQLRLSMPVGDQLESQVQSRLMPEIQVRELVLPMPIDEARAFQEQTGGRNMLEFYAGIDVSAPRDTQGLSVRADIREMLLFPLSGAASQPMDLSPALDRDAALAIITLAKPETENQTEQVAALTPAPAVEPTPEPSPAQVPNQEPEAPAGAALLGSAEVPGEAAPSGSAEEAAVTADWPPVPDVEIARGWQDLLGLRTGMSVSEAEQIILERGGVLAAFEQPFAQREPAPAQDLTAPVQALNFRRLYVASDGNEAITIAAPGPEGPVLAIMRRLQLPRGDPPFETIRAALFDKYGTPKMDGSPAGGPEDLIWYSGEPGAQQSICGVNMRGSTRLRTWTRLANIGDPAFDISASPAAWDYTLFDFPTRLSELMSICEEVVSFAPATKDATGAGDAFSMFVVDAGGLLRMEEAMAGVVPASDIEIDF